MPSVKFRSCRTRETKDEETVNVCVEHVPDYDTYETKFVVAGDSELRFEYVTMGDERLNSFNATAVAAYCCAVSYLRGHDLYGSYGIVSPINEDDAEVFLNDVGWE